MFPSSTPPQPLKPPSKPQPKQRRNYVGKYAPWVLIALGLIFIGWMIATNKAQKPYTCSHEGGGVNSLTTMGTCTTN